MSEEATNLINQWDYHNHPHKCSYDGVVSGFRCPADNADLREFLNERGFPVPDSAVRISGRRLDEPSFRSRISGTEFLVSESPVVDYAPLVADGPSIKELRGQARGRREFYNPGGKVKDTVTEVPEKPQDAPQRPGINTVASDAMEYYKQRLDGIENLVNQVLVDVDSLARVVERVEDALTERSEVFIRQPRTTPDELKEAIYKVFPDLRPDGPVE